MARIDIGELSLGYRVYGDGPVTVVFIHGNLASKDWIELSAPYLPSDLRVVGIDWRGCGDSDRPPADPDFANYSMAQHAADMLAALDALDIPFCHLATHSTGGIISTRMLLAAPERFGKVLALDPVTPLGLAFDERARAIFEAMQASRDATWAVMATAASSLFAPETLVPGSMPKFGAATDEVKAQFERIVDQTFSVSEGIWFGTPHNLTLENQKGELAKRMADITHEHLLLLGELDAWIPAADLQRMVGEMPNCRLVTVPNVGHSMNLEQPALFAGYMGAFFSGLAR